jgi:hypothetical protein
LALLTLRKISLKEFVFNRWSLSLRLDFLVAFMDFLIRHTLLSFPSRTSQFQLYNHPIANHTRPQTYRIVDTVSLNIPSDHVLLVWFRAVVFNLGYAKKC